MAEGPWSLKGQRTKVLRVARDLARSGQHQSHESIVEELKQVEAFAEAHRCLTTRAISAQLDKLCAMASVQAGAPSLAAYIAETRQAARTQPGDKR